MTSRYSCCRAELSWIRYCTPAMRRKTVVEYFTPTGARGSLYTDCDIFATDDGLVGGGGRVVRPPRCRTPVGAFSCGAEEAARRLWRRIVDALFLIYTAYWSRLSCPPRSCQLPPNTTARNLAKLAVTPEDLATLERFLVAELSASRLEAVVEGARADVV